ncbi:MAG: tetratricopeptide repeat protein [Vicingaceae bacterium]|nr:tetratricopeptide repeat protein [Vicingaceae bacterium]
MKYNFIYFNKRRLYLLLSFMLLISFASAQQVKTYLKKDDLVNTLSELPEDDYRNRIDYLKSNINKNDTLYPDMLILLSYYEIQDKNYENAIKYCDEGLKINDISINNSFYNNKATALIELKKYSEALNTIKEGLKHYPKNANLHYVNGLIYEAKEEYINAINWYQKAIKLAPFKASYHYKLGEVMYLADLVTQSALCFNMYLILNPDGSGSLSVLSALNTMLTSKNEEQKFNKNTLENYKTFQELDVLVKNYVALNKKYKTPSKIDLPYIKQSHLIFSSLKEIDKKDDFWGNYYIPFFQYIMDNNLFEHYSYTVSYMINNESKYKPIVLKNESNIVKFIDNVFGKWSDIISEETINKNEVKKYIYDNKELSGIGVVKKGTLNGNWTTYRDNGKVFSEGLINPSNNRDGKWIFYHENGNISEEANYNDGKLTDAYKAFFDNKKLSKTYHYKDGLVVGKYSIYNKRGALVEEGEYNEKEELLTQTFYYNLGKDYLNYKVSYKNNKIDGLITILYENGKTKSIINFSEGKRKGEEKEFYFSGNKKSVFSNLNDEPEGDYISYYENGNVESKGKYKQGTMIGNWQYFNPNGEKTEEVFYDEKGKKTGVYKQYDIDGVLFNEIDYKNETPIAYRFYNKNGEIIKDVKKSKGSFEYEGFYADGIVSTKGTYKLELGKEGRWEYYNQNGTLSSIEHFKDGKLHGEEIRYHANNKISDTWTYNNDTLSGYYANYLADGNIYAQGWYENDNRVGEWIYYFSDTTISQTLYYIDGKLHGKQKYFNTDQKAYSVETYNLGSLIKTEYFDTNQTLYETIYEDSLYGNKQAVVHYANGNIRKKYNTLNGIFHNQYNAYYPDNKLNISGEFINGKKENEWTWYHINGKISSKGKYYQDEKHGVWMYFDIDGIQTHKKIYSYGKLDGEQLNYHTNGNISQKTYYRNGKQHGEKSFYDNKNNLQLVRYYHNGKLTGYSYLNKEGKLLPEIKLTNETGEIVAYYKNGQLSRKMTFKNGELLGAYEEFYNNGQLIELEKYKDTGREGEVISYYEDGKIKEKKNYHLGELHGNYEEFYPNGKLKIKSNYVDGEFYGWYYYFDSNGNQLNKNYYIANNILY